MNNRILILIAVFTLLSIKSYSESIRWISMNEALELNKTQPKRIFIDIYTSWCGWCKKMDASTFKQPDVVRYLNQHLYCVKFDAEGSDTVIFKGRTYTNQKVAGKRSTHPFAAILLGGQMTYPSFVILDDKLRGVSMIKGYKAGPEMYILLRYFVSESFKNESLDQFKARMKEEEEE